MTLHHKQSFSSAQMMTRTRRYLLKTWRFLTFVTRRFFENDGTYRAAALTLTTLLAIVPLMSVSFTILSAFPIFQKVYKPIQDFIFANFVPATGHIVQQYVQGFVKQVSQLSYWGIVFLFVTAVLVIFTIEQALNAIWRVRYWRRGVSAFMLYWGVLTLAPVLMGMSLVASSYLSTLPLWNSAVAGVSFQKLQLLRWLPALMILIVFTVLYVAVPNCKVLFRHGFIGACFSTILFEAARMGFTFYLTQYPTYQLLYGAFATVPIFFLWVYWVWVIVLLGAEVSHALSAHYDRRLGPKLDAFTHSLTWLKHLWLAQQRGKKLTLRALINLDDVNYDVDPDVLMARLQQADLVEMLPTGEYLLTSDLQHLSLLELYQRIGWQLPPFERVTCLPHSHMTVWVGWLKTVTERNQNLMNQTVSEVLGLKADI